LSRDFSVACLGVGSRVTIRADAFNLFNHANLNNPDSTFGMPVPAPFGLALFGRQGISTGFPAVSPVNELPRQFQVQLRLRF